MQELFGGDGHGGEGNVVAKYINGIRINEITVLSSDEERRDVLVRLDYTITRGIQEETDSLITKI